VFDAAGLVLAGALGVAGLVAAFPGGVTRRFAGGWEARPIAAIASCIGALGLAGAPLWPTFWGEDLVVHAALERSSAVAFGLAAILAVNGYLGVRNFAYAFFGPPGRGA
jgi:NADH:ubiquinone oxidoreductase subunit 5 (subunit L)/multisubunit Na+/H+ antiporter MnhA subunit